MCVGVLARVGVAVRAGPQRQAGTSLVWVPFVLFLRVATLWVFSCGLFLLFPRGCLLPLLRVFVGVVGCGALTPVTTEVIVQYS